MRKYPLILHILLAGVLIALFGIMPIAAQDTATCEALVNQLPEATATLCEGVVSGGACTGTDSVQIVAADGSAIETEAGETIALANVMAVSTDVINPADETWGIAVLKVDAGLTDNAVQMVLFGEAEMVNQVAALEGEPPTLSLKNVAGYAVNLRGEPGTNAPVVGTLDKNAEAVTDGRNATNEWFRLQIEDGIGWVHHSLVSVDGDSSTLAVLDSPYTEPMQAFTLSTGKDTPCGVLASGLLIQLTGEDEVRIQVNGVELVFADAVLLLQAFPNEALYVQVIEGSVSVSANLTIFVGEAGQSVQVALGGDDTLTPSGAPQVKKQYSFEMVGGAPFAALGNENPVCLVGVVGDDAEAMTYGGPGDAYSALSALNTDAHYMATGYAMDEADRNWWKLDTDRWVQQTDVRTVGLCGNVLAVEPPQLVSAPATNNTTSSSGGSGSGESFLPAGQSVWQATSGQDVMTGACSTPPIAICSHPAAIIPNADGSINWRGQEPVPYLLSPTGTNNYFHTGRNFMNNANVSLDLTLTSESTWSLAFSTVYDSDPTCTHTFYYTATRKW